MFIKDCRTAKKIKICALCAEFTRLELEIRNLVKYLALDL